MRISDWSSDVCSSDLVDVAAVVWPGAAAGRRRHRARAHRPRAIKARSARASGRPGVVMAAFSAIAAILAVVVFAAVLWPLWRESRGVEIGRASCRERVCQYV